MSTGLRLTAFLSMIIISLHGQLYAQKEDVVVRYYSMKDGMSHDNSICLLEDSQGFLWIGTAKGLNKFDGYQFTTYLHNPYNVNSLSNDIIYGDNLWEDKQQRIWVGSYGGLDVLDPKTEKFYHVTLDSTIDAAPHLHINRRIKVKSIEERKDGKVWICTSKGIYLVNPDDLTAEKLHHLSQHTKPVGTTEDSLNSAFHDIVETQDGSVWVASRNGLVWWDAATEQTRIYRHDPHDPKTLSNNIVNKIYIDDQDQVWIGTFSSFELYNPDDQTFTAFLPERLQSNEPVMDRFQVFKISEDQNGRLLLGSSDGLYAFDPATETFELLLDKFVWSFLPDGQGSIWVGSPTGLYQLASQSDKFNLISASNQMLVPLYQPSGAAKVKYIEKILSLTDTTAYVGSDIKGVIPDDEGGGWLLSFNKLEKFNPKSRTFTSIALPFRAKMLYKDKQGRIWVGGWGDLGVFFPKTKTFEHLPALPAERINYFCEDTDGNMWIATEIGLIRYDLETRQQDIFQNDPTDLQSLSNNQVYVIKTDQSGNLWVGTDRGLNKLIPGTQSEEPKFTQWLSTNSDLPNDEVRGIVDGGDGTLWLGSGNQISHFFPQSGKFRNYDYYDGLHGQLIFDGKRIKAGRIYFISRNAAIFFHPDSLQDNPYVPPVRLTNFTLHNQPVPVRGSYEDTLDWESPLEHTITHTKSLSLPHWQNDFSLEFAALNYINPEKNQYQYRLEPYEKEWISTTSDNRITRYTNLSPGEYTFRVKASNNDGLWNEEGTSLQLTILPPWWQTGWAYGLYVILGLGLLFGLRQYTVKRERLRHELNLQRMEAEKMHTVDQMKSRFFANISHEFRTPLTLILGPLEKYMQQTEADNNEQQTFRMMRRNARRLLHLINQLLDLSKLEAGKMQLHATPQPILSFLQPIGLSFSTLAERKEIVYHFRYPKENLVLYFDADKLEKIITNLLSNAFKFTPAGGEVIFSASLKPKPGKAKGNGYAAERLLELEVQDNGTGMDEEQLAHIFQRFYQVHSTHDTDSEGSGIGLSLVKELVDLHGGEISVDSEKGKGSCFTISISLKEADFEAIVSQPVQEKEMLLTDDEQEAETTGSAPAEQPAEAPLLLVVEDNADVRTFVCESLKADYCLLEAANGREGYEKAIEAIPDLVLSDVMMPEMDGVELCNRLKADERTTHVPIILLTAKASGGDKIEGLQTGADDYIVKPFEAKELAARIDNLIKSRRKLREQFSREITLQPSAIQITSADEQFLQEVMEIVEANMANFNFSEAVLHHQMSVSKTQLYRKLKALTDHAPSEFIQMMRLERAAKLLAAKAGNVGEISFAVGFRDHSYFSRRFHKQYGMTPSEYAASGGK